MHMKKLVLVAIVFTLLFISGCSVITTPETESPIISSSVLSSDFAAYKELLTLLPQGTQNSRSVDSNETDYSEYFYKAILKEGASLQDFFSLLSINKILATHITYINRTETVMGGMALYNSFDSSFPDIAIILEEINASRDPDIYPYLEISDISVIAFDFVSPTFTSANDLLSNELISSVEELYPEEYVAYAKAESNVVSSVSRGMFGSSTFEPNYHRIRVSESENNKVFQWWGRWDSQSRLDRLHLGDSPAFEPDIKIRYSTFLGLPTKGWAQPNPRVNNHYWTSNLPDSYLDTQTSDMAIRSFYVGTTSAEKMNLNTLYHFYISSPKWNSTKTKHREIAYELQQWQKSGSKERNPWSVGVTIGASTKAELVVFGIGSQHATFDRSY
jgi:hypothetical protein